MSLVVCLWRGLVTEVLTTDPAQKGLKVHIIDYGEGRCRIPRIRGKGCEQASIHCDRVDEVHPKVAAYLKRRRK